MTTTPPSEFGQVRYDINVSERGLAPELVAINPAGQLPTESTVVQQANVEASVQPTPTVIDGPPT
ncbi:hypothetical protein ACOSQ4_005109 [Xanthoceras sorbifolium]